MPSSPLPRARRPAETNDTDHARARRRTAIMPSGADDARSVAGRIRVAKGCTGWRVEQPSHCEGGGAAPHDEVTNDGVTNDEVTKTPQRASRSRLSFVMVTSVSKYSGL